MRLTLFSFLSLCLICCGGDDDDGPSYNFKDQDLSGEIDDQAWTYADGFSELTTLEGNEYADISLVLDQAETSCDIASIEGNYLFFYVPAEVGVYKLKPVDFSGSFEDNQTVTFLVNEDVPNNVIAQKGAIEVLSITETKITGRMDVRFDDEFFVNGNFEVDRCD